jgi:hypothetical protein
MKSFFMVRMLFWFTAAILIQVRAEGQPVGKSLYSGFEASYQIQTSTLGSNLPLLNDLPVVMRGGSAGLILGSTSWKAKLNIIGSYHATNQIQYSIDLKRSEALLYFYPQQLIAKGKSGKLNFYIASGISRDKYKFFGTYLIDEFTGECIILPATNTLNQWNMTGGVGLEYRIKLKDQFVGLYAEARKSLPAFANSGQAEFQNTINRQITVFNVGINFGLHH